MEAYLNHDGSHFTRSNTSFPSGRQNDLLVTSPLKYATQLRWFALEGPTCVNLDVCRGRGTSRLTVGAALRTRPTPETGTLKSLLAWSAHEYLEKCFYSWYPHGYGNIHQVSWADSSLDRRSILQCERHDEQCYSTSEQWLTYQSVA